MNKIVMVGLLCTTSPNAVVADDTAEIILSFYGSKWRERAKNAMIEEMNADKARRLATPSRILTRSDISDESIILPNRSLVV